MSRDHTHSSGLARSHLAPSSSSPSPVSGACANLSTFYIHRKRSPRRQLLAALRRLHPYLLSQHQATMHPHLRRVQRGSSHYRRAPSYLPLPNSRNRVTNSDLAAMMSSTSIGGLDGSSPVAMPAARNGLKGRLRRAFSLNAAQTLRENEVNGKRKKNQSMAIRRDDEGEEKSAYLQLAL